MISSLVAAQQEGLVIGFAVESERIKVLKVKGEKLKVNIAVWGGH
jgi:hypothetical protein